MPLDPLIANPTPVQVKDPMEQYGEFLKNNYLAQEIAKARREEDDDTAYNALMKRNVKSDGTYDRNALLGDAANSNLGKKIPLIQKGFAELDKTNAEAGATRSKGMKDYSEAVKTAYESNDKSLDKMSLDPTVGSKQYDDYIKSTFADPIIGPNLLKKGQTEDQWKAIKDQNTTDKTTWANFLLKAKAGLPVVAKQHIDQVNLGGHVITQATPENSLTTPTPTTIADNKVTLSPNRKQNVVNVNNLPENKAGAAFSEGLGKDVMDEYKNLRTGATAAQDAVDKAQRIRALVKSGAITGAGANLKMNIANVAAALGFTPDPRLSASQELQKYLAANVFDSVAAMKNAGAPISRLTNMELELAKQGAPSQNLTADTIDAMSKDIIQNAQKQTAKFNNRTRELKNIPQMDPALREMAFHELDIPGVPKAAIDYLVKNPQAAADFDKKYDHPGLSTLILQGGTQTGGAPFPGSR